ncbi:MAG TPA: acetoacetate decarboxylase family protein [Ktedonobacterales bacterium]|nr:acetoacetate decarboxylase family protein [Ktedonobacterales bacterium]
MAQAAWATEIAAVPETPYPPAPWQAISQYWAGLFRASSPAGLPPRLRPLLGSHTRVVTVVRYLPSSTLVYDELIVAVPVLVGWRPGLYIDHIWVDSLASLWGGRRIWGLPKNLADFAWSDHGVTVADNAGLIMELALDRSPARGPALPFATAGIGQLGDHWAWGVVPMRARFGGAGLRIAAMSPRFGFQLSARPSIAVASRDCRVTFPGPKLLQ